MMLDQKTFLTVVRSAPLVSVDMIVRDRDDRVLLGLRANQPARGWWFVPGGVIQKGETVRQALTRVFNRELGQELGGELDRGLAPGRVRFQGVYEHFYDDNFASAPGVSTHYVVLAHEIRITDTDGVHPDQQHDGFRWMDVRSLLAAEDVHEYTKSYFIYDQLHEEERI